MEIKDRIKIIMEKENMASGAFAESIGIQQSTLSHILNGRNNPSLDVIMKVHQKYNYVKLEWLLYGQGNISEESIQSASDFQPSLFAENAIIPPNGTVTPENRREMPLESSQNTPKEIVKQEIRYIEKPSRKITEIKFSSMIIRMRHSEEKNKTDKSLFAQFPVSLQDEYEFTFNNT